MDNTAMNHLKFIAMRDKEKKLNRQNHCFSYVIIMSGLTFIIIKGHLCKY